LLNAARALARDAERLRKEFLAYGMPKDFLDTLQGGIRRLEEASRHRTAGVSAHVAARAEITRTMKAALAAVCRLDAVVANRFKNDPAALTMWRRVRRLTPARNGQRARNGLREAQRPRAS
jgi:hypothetical protein